MGWGIFLPVALLITYGVEVESYEILAYYGLLKDHPSSSISKPKKSLIGAISLLRQSLLYTTS